MRGQDGTAPLHLAAQKGHAEVVARLIAARCKINQATEVGGQYFLERFLGLGVMVGVLMCWWLRTPCLNGFGWSMQRRRWDGWFCVGSVRNYFMGGHRVVCGAWQMSRVDVCVLWRDKAE